MHPIIYYKVATPDVMTVVFTLGSSPPRMSLTWDSSLTSPSRPSLFQ